MKKRKNGLTRREWLSTAAGAGALMAAPRLNAQAAKVQLSMCLSDNDRTRPLKEGRVKADALDLVISTAHPSEMFWRELHFNEFDISEMSCSSLLMAIAHGDKRFVALPVFTSRSFFHTGILVRTDRGINQCPIGRVRARTVDGDADDRARARSARAREVSAPAAARLTEAHRCLWPPWRRQPTA